MVKLLPGGLGYGSPEFIKHAVCLVRGSRGGDGEACIIPWVALIHGRLGSVEAPQDQVVVCFVSHGPYRYVLEQMNVCAQDVVGLVAHLPVAPVHGPCAAILQPRLVPWEEVAAYVLRALLRQGCCNPLVPLLALWCVQVDVEISNHQQSGPPGPIADGCEDVLY